MIVKIYIIICLLVFSTANSQNANVDTRVGDLELLESQGIIKRLGNQAGKLIEDEGPGRVTYFNKDKSEYLTMYHLPGASANDFNIFEIGKFDNGMPDHEVSEFESFVTDGNTRLDMSIDGFLKLRNLDFDIAEYNGYTVYTYRLADYNNELLKKYNMPFYLAEYYFRDNRLVKIKFGFPAP